MATVCEQDLESRPPKKGGARNIILAGMLIGSLGLGLLIDGVQNFRKGNIARYQTGLTVPLGDQGYSLSEPNQGVEVTAPMPEVLSPVVTGVYGINPEQLINLEGITIPEHLPLLSDSFPISPEEGVVILELKTKALDPAVSEKVPELVGLDEHVRMVLNAPYPLQDDIYYKDYAQSINNVNIPEFLLPYISAEYRVRLENGENLYQVARGQNDTQLLMAIGHNMLQEKRKAKDFGESEELRLDYLNSYKRHVAHAMYFLQAKQFVEIFGVLNAKASQGWGSEAFETFWSSREGYDILTDLLSYTFFTNQVRENLYLLTIDTIADEDGRYTDEYLRNAHADTHISFDLYSTLVYLRALLEGSSHTPFLPHYSYAVS